MSQADGLLPVSLLISMYASVGVAQVKEMYYPEVRSLLQRLTSSSRVEVIQHNVRKGKIQKG